MSRKETHYDYRNAQGALVGYVTRVDYPGEEKRKDILPFFIPDNAAGFKPGMPEGCRPLYGLQNALKAANDPIFIVEGEKCAAALQGLGFSAVCSPGGSNAAHLADWKVLAGHKGGFYLLPDNDPAGEKYAEAVAQALGHEKIKVVRLPGLPEKGDVVDWLQRLHPTWNGMDNLKFFLKDERWDATAALFKDECQRYASPWKTPSATPATSATDEGPIPLRPAPRPMTRFPMEALGPLEAPVRACAKLTNAHPITCAQAFLAAGVLAVQGLRDVEFLNGTTLPISCFFLTVAASGDGKSACDKYALRPIRERQRELDDEHQTHMKKWKMKQQVWEVQQKRLLKGNKSTEAKTMELMALGDEPEKPLLPYLVCEEPTFEGLCRLMMDGQPSQGIFTDEGGQFIGGHGMADDNRMRTITNLSKFWDGADISRVRASGDARIVRGKRLTIHLMLQPIIAMQTMTTPLLRGQGFMARYLVAYPPSMGGKRLFQEPDPQSLAMVEDYTRHLLGILRLPLPMKEGSRNELAPPAMKLTPSQRLRWIAFQHDVERKRAQNAEWQCIYELAGKIPEHALRLAGVLTLLKNPQALALTDEALEGGMALATFYAEEAVRMDEMGFTKDDVQYAELLLDWLQRKGKTTFTVRQVCYAGPNRIRDKQKVTQAVAVLVSYGWIEKNEGKKSYTLLEVSQLSQGEAGEKSE